MTEQIPPQADDPVEKIRHWLFALLCLAAILLALLRAFGYSTIDKDVLYFLVAGGLFLVLDRIKKLSIGTDGISAEVGEQIKSQLASVGNQVTQVRQVAAENQRALTEGVGGKQNSKTEPTALAEKVALPQELSPGFPDDPQKGRFGGLAENNGRKLSAQVTPAKGYQGNYNICLEVCSTDTTKPLQGIVTFYLHDTFNRPIRKIQPRNGVARLELLAYGAFTVGVLADDGKTKLELDLSQDERFPKAFRDS